MTDVKFFGLDSEQANIKLTRDGVSDSFTTTWSASSNPTADHIFQVSEQEPITNVVGIGGNKEDEFGSFLHIRRPGPSRHALLQSVKARGGDNLILGDYSSFDVLGDGFFNGKAIQLYAINDSDELELMRETTVVDHRVRDWRNRGTTDQLTYTVELQSWYMVNRTYWFGVRKLSATGDYGDTAYGTSATVEGDGAFSGTSSTDTNFTETEVYDSALTAPTGFSLSKVSGERAVTLSWNDDGHLATGGQFEIVLMHYDPTTRAKNGIEIAAGGGVAVKSDMVFMVVNEDLYDDRDKVSPRTAGLTGIGWGQNPYSHKGSSQGSDSSKGFFNGQAANGSTWTTVEKADFTGLPYLDEDCPWYYTLTLNAGDVFPIWGWEYGDTTSANYPAPVIGDTYKLILRASVSSTTAARFVRDGNSLDCKVVGFNGATVDHDLSTDYVFNLVPGTDTYEFEVKWSEDTGSTVIGKLGIELHTAGTYDLGSWRGWNDSAETENAQSADERLIHDYMHAPYMRPHQATKTAGKPYSIKQLISGPKHDLTGYPLHYMLKWCAEQLDRQEAQDTTDGITPRPRQFWQQLDIVYKPSDPDCIPFWMNYMFGAQGSGDGAELREAMGRTAPWADEFDKIYLEFYNEPWNNLAAFLRAWPIIKYSTDEVLNYGHMSGALGQFIWDAVKATPEWSTAQSKLEWLGSGWVNNQFGSRFAEYAPDCDKITEAYYHAASWEQGGAATDGGDDGYGAQVAWAATVSERSKTNAFDNLGAVNAQRASDSQVGLCVYEMGPTVSSLSGVPDSERRQAQSVAAGGTCIAQSLNQIRAGYDPVCFFKFQRGSIWSIGQDGDGGDFNCQAHWMHLWNRYCSGGTMYKMIRVGVGTQSTHTINGNAYTYSEVDAWWAAAPNGDDWLFLKSYMMPRDQLDPASVFYDASDDGVRSVSVRRKDTRTITGFKRHYITADGVENVYNAHNYDSGDPNYATIALNVETLANPTGIDLSFNLPPVGPVAYQISY